MSSLASWQCTQSGSGVPVLILIKYDHHRIVTETSKILTHHDHDHDHHQQTSYLSKSLRNRNFWPQKFTQKKRKSQQNRICDKMAEML